MTERFGWIDHAKGIAILLVVIGHVWLGLYQAGVIEVTPLFSWVIDWIYAFHMPLFFVLAGMLASRSVAAKSLGAFLASKGRTIVYPYFVWSIIQTGLQLVFRSEVNHAENWSAILSIAYKPVGQFWFLYSLFVLYVMFGALRALRCPVYGFVLLSFGLYLMSRAEFWPWEVAQGVASYGVFFALGVISEPQRIMHLVPGISKVIIVTVVAFAILSVAISYGWHLPLFGRLVIGVCGITGVLGLSLVIAKWRPTLFTSCLGRHSLAIFLAHTIFAATLRTVLLKLGLAQPWLQLCMGILIGLLGPLVLVWTERRLGRPFLFTWPSRRIVK